MADATFDQVNKELDAELQRLGLNSDQQQQQQQQPAGPTKEDYARLEGELQALKSLMEQQTNQRFVGPEGDRATPQPQQTQKAEPWTFTPDKFVEAASQDPGQAVLDALNSKLGLPKGANVFGAFGIIGEKLKEMETNNKQLQERLQNELIERHAERFIDTHPEYEPTKENYQALQGYMQQYNLPPTVQGYELALAKAIHDGRIESRQQEHEQQQTQQQFDPFAQQSQRGPQFIPSINQRSPAPGEQDVNSLISKLDKMSTADAMSFAERIFKGQ